MAQFLGGLFALLSTLKSLMEIGIILFRFIRDEYERERRAAVAKEIKAAVKESVDTLDNTRLIKLLDPNSEPFPRKTS
jgi:hypothetical protein